MTLPQIGPTSGGTCEGCGVRGPRWDLAIAGHTSRLCAGCLTATAAVIKTELGRPHLRGIAGDRRTAIRVQR